MQHKFSHISGLQRSAHASSVAATDAASQVQVQSREPGPKELKHTKKMFIRVRIVSLFFLPGRKFITLIKIILN